jgi:hypothetical protein
MSDFGNILGHWAGELGLHSTHLWLITRNDSLTYAMLLPPTLDDESICNHLPDATPLASYSPTGRWCWYKPRIRRTRTRTLVTQRQAFDC